MKSLVYLALDIRESFKLNQFLKEIHGGKELINFYSLFKRKSDRVAINKYKAVLSRQIVDTLSYVWKEKDKFKAIKAALEINDSVIKYLACKYGVSIKLGIGISLGYGEIQKVSDEVIGDLSRNAFALQEGKYCITSDFQIPTINVDGVRYIGIKHKDIVRGELVSCFKIVKKEEKQSVLKRVTEKVLEELNLVGQDCHSHLEGTNLNSKILENLFIKSVNDIENDPVKRDIFLNSTQYDFKEIRKLYEEIHENIEKGNQQFTFEEFLKKLHLAKVCLASSPQNAKQFVKATVDNELKKIHFNTFGFTPSIPLDYPYLDREEWYRYVVDAIKEKIEKPRLTTFVMETKRQHLLNGYYLKNLEFLKMLHNQIPALKIAIGLVDDASKYPLIDRKSQIRYKDYVLKSQEISKSVGVQIHELEQYDLTNPLKEINFLLDFYDEIGLKGVTWIHMSYLNPNAEVVNSEISGMILNRIVARQDRVIVNPTSNLRLAGEIFIDNEDFIEIVLENDFNISIGTDDSFAFNISDIEHEYNMLKDYLTMQGHDYGTVNELMGLMRKNSWKSFSEAAKLWIMPSKEELVRFFNFDPVAFNTLIR